MLPLLQEIFTSRSVVTQEGARLPLHSHLPLADGELLQAWLAEHRPRRVLEIGMAYGISSLLICDALTQIGACDYHIVDPFQHTDWCSVGVANMQRAGFADAYVLHVEPSELCLPRLLGQQTRIDCAFVDGFHTFDHALVDFFFVNRMLDVGGIVIFDDVQLPSIQKLMAYIGAYPCYRPLPLPAGWDSQRAIRVRRLMNSPLTRIGGFVKIADDKRAWHWHHDF
jgi:predicted O-methyltransferase YrrM